MWQTGSYSNATYNFKVEKLAGKSVQNLRSLNENGAQNLQVTCAEFSIFWHRILSTLVMSDHHGADFMDYF